VRALTAFVSKALREPPSQLHSRYWRGSTNDPAHTLVAFSRPRPARRGTDSWSSRHIRSPNRVTPTDRRRVFRPLDASSETLRWLAAFSVRLRGVLRQPLARRLATDCHDGQVCTSLRPQISGLTPAIPFRSRGAVARRHERGTGCGGRESVGAQGRSQGGLNLVSDSRRAGRTTF
jgi:hypothetical protein